MDIWKLNPMDINSADAYVQSVMAPSNVEKIANTADVHAEKPVSNFNTSTYRGKRPLESDRCPESAKKFKKTNVNKGDDIIRLANSPPCDCITNTTSEYSSDKSEI